MSAYNLALPYSAGRKIIQERRIRGCFGKEGGEGGTEGEKDGHRMVKPTPGFFMDKSPTIQ